MAELVRLAPTICNLMMNSKPLYASAFVLASALLCGAAHAGRPLAVDDANVDAAGTGHVEAWLAQAPGARVYNIAPAWAPVDGLELDALLARDRRAAVTLSALQAKWRITPSREQGCNVGAVAGLGHATDSANSTYLNGLLSCNHPDLGSTHFNLGVSRLRHVASRASWGVAYEKPLARVTPHIEWFGSEGARPTIQAGLRGDITQGVQLDGSVGRSGGSTLYTIGAKFQF